MTIQTDAQVIRARIDAREIKSDADYMAEKARKKAKTDPMRLRLQKLSLLPLPPRRR